MTATATPEPAAAVAPVTDAKKRMVELVGGPRCGDAVEWLGAKTQHVPYYAGEAVYELESETKALYRHG